MPRKLTKKEFIERSIKIHGKSYDYSEVKYINSYTKVKIYCKNHKVWFWQTPSNHLSGITSCVQCANIKREQTTLKNYGVKRALQSSKIYKQFEETMMLRYNVKNAFYLKKFKIKATETCFKNYGVENPMQSPEIKEKVKQTTLKRFGKEFASQTTIFHEKVKQTNLKKYGVEYTAQLQISNESLNKLTNIIWLKNEHHIKRKTLAQIGYELNVNESTVGRHLKKHNIEIKYFKQSTGEHRLGVFIISLGYDILTNKKNIIPPLEIDVFVPEKNKAFEYNGLYWHKNLGENYHLNKTDLCSIQKIPLFHVWEDMWLNYRKETEIMIIKFLNDEPQVDLLNQIKINLATDNPQIYLDLGYKIISQIEPRLYSQNIWDCGNIILNKF